MRYWILFVTVAVLGASSDLISKQLVFDKVAEGEQQEVIAGYFYFLTTYNEGIAFGQFKGASKIWLVASILAVPLIVGVFSRMKKSRAYFAFSLGLILAGAMGNLYDRAVFGKVRDFLYFTYDQSHAWNIFNVADAYICAGVLLLCVQMMFFEKKKPKKEAAPRESSPDASSAG